MTTTARTLTLVIAVVVVAHGPRLRCGYVYDDFQAIVDNPRLSSFADAEQLLLSNYWGSRNIGLYRPLTQLSYLLDGAVFGFNPTVSHLIQLILHVSVVGLLMLFLRELGVSPRQAALGCVLFGCSPALLDASVWISGRADVLCALFVLLGLLMAVRAQRRGEGPWGRCTVALASCYLAGLMSKEMAVTLPILVLLLPKARARLRLPLLMASAAVYGWLRWVAVDGLLPVEAGEGAGALFADRGIVDRFALGCRATLRVLAWCVVPWGLAADYRAHPWALPDTAVGVSGACSVLIWSGALWLGRRWRSVRPRDGFLLFACLVSFLPVLQLVPIGAVMAGRFAYLPGLFFMPLLVAVAARWMGRRRAPRLELVSAVAAVLVSVALTWHRVPVYTDRGTFSVDVVTRYPGDHRAWNNLGVYLYLPDERLERHDADFDGADEAFSRAMAIRSTYRMARLNRARALLERQRVADPEVDLGPLEDWLGPGVRGQDPAALYLAGKADLRRGKRSDQGEGRRALLDRAHDRLVAAAGGFGPPRRAAAAWKEAGLAARANGRADLMRAAWRQALALVPDMQGAAAMRRSLE